MQEDRWENWFLPGEHLRWEGAPVSGRIKWGRNLFLSCFGAPFFGGGLLVVGTALGHVSDGGVPFGWVMSVFLLAFSIPFLAVGLGLMFGPWLGDFLLPRRTRYALTDRAGYIATNYWHRNMKVVPLNPGTRVEYEDAGRGSGNVYFHYVQRADSDGDKTLTRSGFEGIADARKVYDLVRKFTDNIGPEHPA